MKKNVHCEEFRIQWKQKFPFRFYISDSNSTLLYARIPGELLYNSFTLKLPRIEREKPIKS